MSETSWAIASSSPRSSWTVSFGFAAMAVLMIVLLFYGHWSALIFAALLIVTFSTIENQTALLVSIFLLPAAWVIKGGTPISNVVLPARDLSLIAFFLGRVWRRNLRIGQFLESKVLRATLALLGVCGISVAFGKVGWTHNSARALSLVGSSILLFFFVLEWVDSLERLNKVVRTLFWSTIVVALFGMLQEIMGSYTEFWMYLYPRDEGFIEWNNRVPSFLGYSNLLAGYLNLMLPLALGCWFFGDSKTKKLAMWTAILGSVALVLTQSRAGMMAFACVGLLSILKFVGRSWKTLVCLLALALAGVGVYLIGKLLSPAHLGSIVQREPMERLLFWATAWRLFLSSPWIGIGIGNYGDVYGFYIPASLIPARVFTANGLYFQLISEIGITGLAAFMGLAVVSIADSRRLLQAAATPLLRAVAFAVLAGMIATLVHGLVDLALDVSPQWTSLFWFMLGLLIVGQGLHRDQKLRPVTE